MPFHLTKSVLGSRSSPTSGRRRLRGARHPCQEVATSEESVNHADTRAKNKLVATQSGGFPLRSDAVQGAYRARRQTWRNLWAMISASEWLKRCWRPIHTARTENDHAPDPACKEVGSACERPETESEPILKPVDYLGWRSGALRRIASASKNFALAIDLARKSNVMHRGGLPTIAVHPSHSM